MPDLRTALSARKGIFVRYAAGSVVAMGCSEIVLIGTISLTPPHFPFNSSFCYAPAVLKLGGFEHGYGR